MKRLKLFKSCFVVALLLASTLAVGAAGGATAASSGLVDELRMGLSLEPATMDPHMQSGQATRIIKQNVYRGLVSYEADGKIGYEVAESYTVSNDGLTFTFKIKPNATFHDGTTVTAEDVKFSIERIMDTKTKATFGADFRTLVDRCEVVSAKVVKIILKAPVAPFIDYLALPESAIVSKAWTQSHNNDLDANPMGSGPYKFTKWEKGREIVLTAVNGFYKPNKPATKTLRFVFYTDDTTRANALRSGEVDLIDYVPSKEVINFQKEKGIIVDISEAPFMMIQFNCQKGSIFADSRIRKAVAYAVDRQAVIDTAFMGRGTQIFGFPTRLGQNGYDGKYDKYFSYDLAKAKALLAEAGFPNGFKVKMLSTATYEMHKQTALVIQDSLKKIGITVEVELPDWATRIDRTNKGQYDFLITGTTGNIVDMDWCANYFAGGEPRLNSSAWFQDDEIEKLLAEGRRTFDPAKRAAIYDKFRLRALDLSPFVYINYREQCFARSNKVSNFKNLDGILTFISGITLEDVVVSK